MQINKGKNINCEIVFITPYLTITKQAEHNIIKNSLYDSTLYPPLETVPLKLAIIKRNEWMINQADLIIAYVKYTFGGAYKSLLYAIRKNKRIINLAEQL